MGINRYKPHFLVLTEDDANRQIANGFLQNQTLNERAIQVLPPLHGWTSVIQAFVANHVAEMQKWAERRILLIVDFDGHSAERLGSINSQIPPIVAARTFVLGAESNPEELRAALGKSLEEIGKALAKDCEDEKRTVWGCKLLAKNGPELDRLSSSVKQFLFQ